MTQLDISEEVEPKKGLNLSNLVQNSAKAIKNTFTDPDTYINLSFWMPWIGLSELTWMDYTFKETMGARLGQLPFQFFLGRPYGKAINLGRYLFNRSLYDQERNRIPRERKGSAKRKLRKLKDVVVDTATTMVFWTPIMIPILRYACGFEWDEVGTNLALYSLPTVIGGVLYPPYLDKLRRKFNPEQYKGVERRYKDTDLSK